MATPSKTRFAFLSRRLRSFKYAFKGIGHVFLTQENFWIHLFAAVAVIAAGFIVKLTTIEWCLIAFAIGFVFAAETFNTAIESVIDLLSPQYQAKAGKIKDLAAAATLFAAITAAVIGIVIFVPKIV